ncbi:ead/Ea22-like family protein, partial [Enterobacter asburiae]
AAMLQGADGALTNEDTKRVDELVMWIKRLSHSLRKARPDSKLQSDAMDYLSRNGLIGVKDILR